VVYPDDDLSLVVAPDGKGFRITHKDGTPY